MSALLGSFKPIQIARILTAELHPDINIHHSNVADVDLLRYNIENYLLRITVYKDLVLKFINEVYQWKYKAGNGLQREIRKKAEKEKLGGILQMINVLDILMEKVKPIRNTIAHEGSMLSEIAFIEGDDFLWETMPELGNNRLERNAYFKELIEGNLGEMLKIEEDLATNLLSVFDLLFPVFTSEINND